MTTQYARSTGRNCTGCHVIPPKLNAAGEAFLAGGYRLPSGLESKGPGNDDGFEAPALWLTGRHEDQTSKEYRDTFVPKVEIISGGPIGESFSYFLEWRPVSLSANPDGTLQDRGGRFEDAFFHWQFSERHGVRLGQFRSLNQYDVSRRLSVSEPILLNSSLPGEPSSDARIQSLRAFSPAGRSPGISYFFQSLMGDSPADGLFHVATLPFVGELSAPLSTEAQTEASFELEPEVKGVWLETFYRRGLHSVGLHAFLDDDRWIAGALDAFNYEDFYATAGLGMDGGEALPARQRYSGEVEYLPTWFQRVRPGLGFRAEHITASEKEPAFIPYLVVSGPNTFYTLVLQAEGRIQEDSQALIIDVSGIF